MIRIVRYLILLLILLTVGCEEATASPTVEQTHSTTHTLIFTNGMCSGTAIGPNVIETAAHCVELGKKLEIVDKEVVVVIGITYANNDEAFLTLKDANYKTWAAQGKPLKQGDHIHWWGNPEANLNIYREGYVVAIQSGYPILDAMTCKGDSGAGVFNSKGQIVGIISATTKDSSSRCIFTIVR